MTKNIVSVPAGIGHFRHQYYAVFVAVIISFANGLLIGWLTPVLPLLKSDETPLPSGPVSLQEVSWLGSLPSIGGMIGALMLRPLTAYAGCKRMIACLPIPLVIGWLLIIFAKSTVPIMMSRFLCGFICGGADSGTILFVAEIADDRIRGALSSIAIVARNTGYAVAFIVGAYVQYEIVPYLYIGLPVLFLILLSFLPNTAPFLIRHGKYEEAKRSIKYYRGYTDDTPESINAMNQEFERLLAQASQSSNPESTDRSAICRPMVCKALMIAIFLTFLNQYCGCYTLTVYSVVIFQQSGTHIDPHVSSIILGVLQVLGMLCSTSLVEFIGRKKLLIISMAGSALGLSAMSSFMYFDSMGFDLSDVHWIPVVSIGTVVTVSSVGIVPLVFVCVVEMLPSEARGFGITTSIVTLNMFAFISSNTFPILTDSLHLYGSVAIYAIACAAGTVFVTIFINETKGINLDSIGSENAKATRINGA